MKVPSCLGSSPTVNGINFEALMRRPHHYAGACRLVLFLGIASTLAFAQAKSWHVADFKDTISISADGSALVSEKISVVFVGEWHGIHRTIPVEYPGPKGSNYTLFLKVLSVTDGDGNKLKYDSSKSGASRDLKIYIPDAVDATRVVNIDYSVRNGVRYFDDYEEFYWNVTGNDWPVPIDHASAFVVLPDSAAGGLRAQAFTGAYGSKESAADAQVDGANVAVETTRGLPMRGGLTIDIYIPPGIVKVPSGLTKFWWFVGSNPILLLPLLTLAVMAGLWYSVGRDPDPGMSVAPQYEPPKGMTPAEAGTMLDDTIHPRDITSTIVDLAVRGYIKIEEKVDTFLVFHHKDYVFHNLKGEAGWGPDLAPHERVMMENIFEGGATEVRLSSLKNRFYTAIPAIRTDIMSALKNKGVYALDPESANGYSLVAGVAILLLVVAVQVMGWMNLFYSIPLVIGSVLVSALIWWLFARRMTAKTVTGARLHVAVLGFQEFMNRVDQGPHPAHAPGYVRKVSALRDGSRRGTPLGAGVRWNREGSAQLVCVAERLCWFYAAVFFQRHAWHGDRYAPGVRIFSPGQFGRIGIRFGRRLFRGRLQRWRVWRGRGRRVLKPALRPQFVASAFAPKCQVRDQASRYPTSQSFKRWRRSSALSKRIPKPLLLFLQATLPRTQTRGRVSKEKETSTALPGSGGWALFIDIPPQLISWLVAVNREPSPIVTRTSVITGTRT